MHLAAACDGIPKVARCIGALKKKKKKKKKKNTKKKKEEEEEEEEEKDIRYKLKKAMAIAIGLI